MGPKKLNAMNNCTQVTSNVTSVNMEKEETMTLIFTVGIFFGLFLPCPSENQRWSPSVAIL